MRNKEKKFFPLFLDLTEKNVTVAGGGRVAARRVQTLLSFVKSIKVVAPKLAPELRVLEAGGLIQWKNRSFETGDMEHADLVLAATDDPAVNDWIFRECRQRGIMVNTASDQQKCDFQFPGIVEEEDIVIGINSGGCDHRKVREMRQRIQRVCEQPAIIIGSRASKLAVIQSEIVKKHIETRCPGRKAEILTMSTTGDRILDRTLDKIGGKGLFVKELDQALLEKRTHMSVHSLKDMPMEIPEELPIVAFSEREDPRDVLVLQEGATEPDFSRPFGCSSQRRSLQFLELYPQAVIKPVRGNIQTRLKKLDEGEYGGLILAAAGLKRLGLENRIFRYFQPEEMIPAAGQGILAVQARAGEDLDCLSGFEDPDSFWEATAERAFVRRLNGGCSMPAAAYGRIEGEKMTLMGFYADPQTGRRARGEITGDRQEAETLGRLLAETLLEQVRKETEQR